MDILPIPTLPADVQDSSASSTGVSMTMDDDGLPLVAGGTAIA